MAVDSESDVDVLGAANKVTHVGPMSHQGHQSNDDLPPPVVQRYSDYDRAFWRRLLVDVEPYTLAGTLMRIVESQTQIVTAPLVDSLEEQVLLEGLLEDSKPVAQWDLSHLDYLLKTPWRYPPLRWGSRFGRRFEPSLFYGSLDQHALFSEAAYYRWVFLSGMETGFSDRMFSQHSTFEARFKTNQGIHLNSAAFQHMQAVLTDPVDYFPCQQLGSVLRESSIKAFVYASARVKREQEGEPLPANGGYNVALMHPDVLVSQKHRNPVAWLCEATPSVVTFKSGTTLRHFSIDDFLVDGTLPLPA